MCLHPSVSLNNDKNGREISKDKIAVCEKTAGLRSGNSSDLDSACLKALVPVGIFQFSDMHCESRFLDTFGGHNIRPIVSVKNRIKTSMHESGVVHEQLRRARKRTITHFIISMLNLLDADWLKSVQLFH